MALKTASEKTGEEGHVNITIFVMVPRRCRAACESSRICIMLYHGILKTRVTTCM